MELQISPITLIIVLVYVSGLAFQIGRIYEQLRQAKRKAAEQSVHPTGLWVCENCAYDRQQSGANCVNCGTPRR